MANWSVKWQHVLDVAYEAVNEFSSNVKTGGGEQEDQLPGTCLVARVPFERVL